VLGEDECVKIKKATVNFILHKHFCKNKCTVYIQLIFFLCTVLHFPSTFKICSLKSQYIDKTDIHVLY